MSTLMVQANRCDACGWVWVSDAVLLSARIQANEPSRHLGEIGLPIRCAKCKRPNWNHGSTVTDILKRADGTMSEFGARVCDPKDPIHKTAQILSGIVTGPDIRERTIEKDEYSQ